MRISRAYLNNFIDLDGISTQKIADILTSAGLEVDGIEPAAAGFTDVVVVEIIAFEIHPNADKLNICQVSDGKNTFQVVCGASNVYASMKTALAKMGAKLPFMEIKAATLRGVDSHGMLCSHKDLGLADLNQGILDFADDATVGACLREYLDLNDEIIDIDLTPNRGDCLSVLGIARELSVLLSKPLRQIATSKIDEKNLGRIEVNVHEPQDCPRYMGRLLTNVNNSIHSPVWLIEYLRRSGLRSVSLVVDVLNYVMLQVGQPLHAFDAEKINGGIVVRRACQREKITLLDETEMTLGEEDLVIADENAALALAGVMGGLDSSVTEKTHKVFIESAFFTPELIAKTSLRHNIHSDAEHRFVRGVDFELPALALNMATALITTLCEAQAGIASDHTDFSALPKREEITVPIKKVSDVIGIEIKADTIEANLLGLGMKVSHANKILYVKPPSYRFDMTIAEDVVEEVMRLHGYNDIPDRALNLDVQPRVYNFSEYDLKSKLAMRDYQEIVSYSFINEELQHDFCGSESSLPLVNPLNNDMAVMRNSLMPSLVMTAVNNLKRQQNRCRLFEMGKYYHATTSGVSETLVLAGLALGEVHSESWSEAGREVDFFDVKADIESLIAQTQAHPVRFEKGQHQVLHPEQTAVIKSQDHQLGVVGLLHPQLKQRLGIKQKVYLFEIDVRLFQGPNDTQYRPVSKFPSVRRDFAIVVEKSVSCQDLLTSIKAHAGENLQDIIVFDVYDGQNVAENEKSVAIGLILQDSCRTLNETEVNDATEKVLTTLASTFNAKLRDAK